MTTGDRMKLRRKELGVPVEQVASALGVSVATVYRYEKGDIEKVPGTALEPLAKVLHTTAAWLMGWSDQVTPAQSIEAKIGAQPFTPTHKIPILGRISAGLPIYADEHIEGYTYTELNGGAEYFALRVTGDSMTAARINDGDLLIVRRQDIVENGEIAVVIVGDADATVKRFYKEGKTVTLMPQSTNPEHRPQIYNLAEIQVRVIGRVVKNEISY